MKNLLLFSIVFLLSACAGDCVKQYSAYLDLPTCSETVTNQCKKQSVVNAANDIERRFYNATKSYKAAYDKDSLTPEIASEYVSAKDSFCGFVKQIGD